MLDFGLLFIAALAQFVLAFLGIRVSLHPPQKTKRKHYEWGFLIVGLVGSVAIIWSGYRSVSIQEVIAEGIQQIKQKIGIETSGIASARASFDVDNTSSYIMTADSDGIEYLRVLLRYEGPGEAICRLYLTDLSKDGDAKPIASGEQNMLHAEYTGENGTQAYTYSDGSEHFYNLAYISKGASTLTIHSDEFLANHSNVLGQGVYKFKIRTGPGNGKGCPQQHAEIWAKYSGENKLEYLLDRFRQWH